MDQLAQSATNFLLVIHSNHELISYRFQDKQRFLSKITNFPNPHVLNDPADGVPLEFCKGGNTKNQCHAPYQWKEFDEMYIRLDTIAHHDGETDGQSRQNNICALPANAH